MSEIKNMIITISGEPVSGKSTVIESLKMKYTSMGYNVHIEPIGTYWREAALETYAKIKPEIKNPTLDQIHADPDFENFRKEIDLELDKKVKKRGEEINSKSRPNDVYIFDSRLAWKNIPSSFAIRLTVDEQIAGKRVYNDSKRGTEDKYPTEEAATEATRIRKEEEIKRYKMRYGVDLADLNNYNLVVDTSFSNTEELAGIIIDGEKAYREGKSYPKMWASVLTFLSEQRLYSTYDSEIKKLVKIIKEDGFKPELGMVDIAEYEGVKILLNGNHRAAACLETGRTLMPYIVTNRDDLHSQDVSKLIYDDHTLERLYDWGDLIRFHGGEKMGQEKIRDLKYLEDEKGEKGNIKSLKDFKEKHFLAVSKVPKLRKIFGLDKKCTQTTDSLESQQTAQEINEEIR